MADLRKSIMHFARENFGEDYYPVLHGRCTSLECLALLIQPKRGFIPFSKQRMTVLSSVGRFADNPEDFIAMFKSRVRRSKRSLEKEEISSVFDSHDVGVEMLDSMGMDLKMTNVDGDLKLGQLDEEYFLDADIREILSCTTLKSSIMDAYAGHRLYIATGIVYSNKFKLVGARESQLQVGAQASISLPYNASMTHAQASASAGYRHTQSYGCPLTRKSRAPLLFTLARVNYNKASRTLEIPKGKFIGKRVKVLRPRGFKQSSTQGFQECKSERAVFKQYPVVAAAAISGNDENGDTSDDDDIVMAPVELEEED
ncbi:uncharacterized protein LOC116602986 [Nematostella vectensis]|uniref:uncharacterized protein LOC116602986 n=1 Tax=Nematostella vectensis TaxID=45351 RepID=UPI00138FD1F3|nr:uncharacterized protein LOC116602986 [Nematostella vectensis]XP_048586022.1 uncharacterized protein LOC116602986 [Nematostella vectensis]